MKAARTDPHETWLSLKPEQRAQFQADYLEGLVPRSHPLAIPASNEVAKPETYGWHQTEIDAERIASYARTAVMPDRLAIVSEGPNPWLSEADFDSLRQERQALHARKVLEPHAYTKADSQRAFLITDRLDEHSLAAATLADTARRYDRLIKEGPNAGLRAVGVDVSNLEAMPARHREEIEKVGSYLDRKLAARREVQRDAGIGRLLSQRELGSLDAYGKMVSDDTDMRQMSTHYHEGLAKVSERGAAKAAQDLQQPIKRVEFEPIAQRKPSEGRMLGQ